MGRCDLSTWSQIPMAHGQKQFQVKLSQALKQHWYFQKKQNKGCPFSKKNKIPMAHLQESGRLSRSRCKLWIMFLACISLCPESERYDLQLGVKFNGTPPKAIPGQKLSQALKQHHQLALWYFQKKQIKGCPFSKKTKIPMAHLQESGRLSRSRCRLWIMSLVAFSYARNQKMGRCDLSTWSQIPMAHRQKQFQVKSLAKHWNSITSLRSGISQKTK